MLFRLILYRTAESDNPTGLGVSISADDMPCEMEGAFEDHLELLRCYYNFVRPHKALKFGREVRTPAMQAGLTTRMLTFREIFSVPIHFGVQRYVTFVFFHFALFDDVDNSHFSMAALQHRIAEAPNRPQRKRFCLVIVVIVFGGI